MIDEKENVCLQKEVKGYEKIIISDIFPGYYRICLMGTNVHLESLLIYAPKNAYTPDFLKNKQHVYGTAVMLYALRSKHNIGIGDFGDLEKIIRATAQNGGDVIGVNPLGVMSPFTLNEERLLPEGKSHLADVSPYRTLSRLFINYAYIDFEKIEEFKTPDVQKFVLSKAIEDEIKALNEGNYVRYARVLELKLRILSLMFEEFQKNATKQRKDEFKKYQAIKGEELHHLAVFEVLLESLEPCDYWRQWPNNLGQIGTPEIRQFEMQNANRVEFYKYCHWLADNQLRDLQKLAKDLGMKIGLYLDMPIGAASNGAEVWSNPDVYVLKADIGAPADPMRPRGQSWGFTPYHPIELKKQHYRPFIKLVRENMSAAGALRIDHAMGLLRLFWGFFKDDNPVVQGAYVYYDMKDLVAVLTLESQRAKCVVIGEDLGTVPEGFREYMAEHNLLSYKVVSRQKEKDGSFIAPKKYDYMSLAQFSTHDQATCLGFWGNVDVRIFNRCGLYVNEEQFLSNMEARAKDRRNLLKALEDEGMLSAENKAEISKSVLSGEPLPKKIHRLLNEYTAKTESALYLVRLADVYLQSEMDNAPGTVFEYPNWRLKMTVESEKIEASEEFCEMMRIFKKARPK